MFVVNPLLTNVESKPITKTSPDNGGFNTDKRMVNQQAGEEDTIKNIASSRGRLEKLRLVSFLLILGIKALSCPC